MQRRFNILLVLISLSFLWGSSFLAIKVVIQVIPPLLTFGIRFAIAGAVLLLAYVINERRKRQEEIQNEHIIKHQWKDALITASLIIVGGQGLLVWGTQYLSSGMTALLNSTIPLWIAIIAALAFKQHLTKRMIYGLVAGFLGLLTLLNPFPGASPNNGSAINIVGVISLTLSSIFWALGSLYSSKAHLSISILASAGMLMLIGGIILTATSFALGEFKSIHVSHISTNLLVAYLYLIFLCTAFGYVEFFWLLRVESESIANSFAYIVPIIAVFLGWALYEETISLQVLVATGIIMVGVALMVTSSSRKNRKIMV